MGTDVDFDAAHGWAFPFNAIQRMGSVGIEFHLCCCLLEDENIYSAIRTLPITRVVADTVIRFDLTRLD